MELLNVEIKNYRSIHHAKITNIGGITTLIGANNEGKSNIMRAIRLGLTALTDIKYFRLRRRPTGNIRIRRRNDQATYDWATDFPINKQSTPGNAETVIKLEFKLEVEENAEFYSEFGIKTNGRIPVTLSFGKSTLEVDIPKQGPAKRYFRQNQIEIAKFLSNRLRFVYIPAIRTADTAHEILDSLIGRKIREAEAPILAQIEMQLVAARDKALQEIEREILETIGGFVPNIKSVNVYPYSSSNPRIYGRPEFLIEIDDGSSTPIFQKGDGVQSLATLALMRSTSAARGKKQTNVIYAIEEPEAHLHSDAIHKIRAVIDDRKEDSQIIISSHSPIFVQRHSLRSNIIVKDSQASPARTVTEIRRTLGVRPPENLLSASTIVLCEGETDEVFLHRYLCRDESSLKQHVNSGDIAIVEIDGAGNLEFFSKLYLGMSCEVFAFLDNDEAAESAIGRVVERGLLPAANLRKTAHSKRNTTEIEDMFPEKTISGVLEKHSLSPDEIFHDDPSPFSIRAKRLAKRLGTVLRKDQVHEIKVDLNELPLTEVIPTDKNSIATLRALETSLKRHVASHDT